MNISFAHAPVHSPEAVREIVAEAWKIATESEGDDEDRRAIFLQAVVLLGARVSVAMPPETVDLSTFALPGGVRR